MALATNEYTVLSEGKLGKRPEESWLEILRRWLVQCPQCSEVRLVVGAHENDRYVCKDCGNSFVHQTFNCGEGQSGYVIRCGAKQPGLSMKRVSIMSYKSPMLIREPELRWPVVLLAAFITTAIALLAAGMQYVAMTQPYVDPYAGPLLEKALRPGAPEFEQYREQIAIEQLVGTEKLHPFNNLAVEMTATVRNKTGRTISGLEMRGAILDAQNSTVRERTVVVIPTRQTALEPDEAINVRILLENLNKDSERARMAMEVTGIRFD